MVQDAIGHRPVQHAVAGEGTVPAAEGQVRSEDHRAALVATHDDLEEQIGLFAAHRQIADLVEDQRPIGVDLADA